MATRMATSSSQARRPQSARPPRSSRPLNVHVSLKSTQHSTSDHEDLIRSADGEGKALAV